MPTPTVSWGGVVPTEAPDNTAATSPRRPVQDTDRAALARIRSAVISGVHATLITVEAHRGKGLPRQTIVGLPGSAVREGD